MFPAASPAPINASSLQREAILKTGGYWIEAHSGGYITSAPKNGKKRSSHVHLSNRPVGAEYHCWQICPCSGRGYHIKNTAIGLFLNIAKGSVDNGALIGTWDTPNVHSCWAISEAREDLFFIKASFSDKYLTASDDSLLRQDDLPAHWRIIPIPSCSPPTKSSGIPGGNDLNASGSQNVFGLDVGELNVDGCYVIAVRCMLASSALASVADEILRAVIPSANLEITRVEKEMYEEFIQQIPSWKDYFYSLVSISGFRAVGAGPNKKAELRASHLAIALSALASGQIAGAKMLTSNQEFNYLYVQAQEVCTHVFANAGADHPPVAQGGILAAGGGDQNGGHVTNRGRCRARDDVICITEEEREDWTALVYALGALSQNIEHAKATWDWGCVWYSLVELDRHLPKYELCRGNLGTAMIRPTSNLRDSWKQASLWSAALQDVEDMLGKQLSEPSCTELVPIRQLRYTHNRASEKNQTWCTPR